MNNISSVLKTLLLLAFFCAFLLILPTRKNVNTEYVTKTICKIDTITKTDTITRYEPKYITQRVVDTLYITDTLFLPITQKHYAERDKYDVWVSGYEAKMDSIRTYNKTEYKYVEKEVTQEVVVNKYELYLNGGLNTFSGTFIPKVGVSLITPKKTHYNANLGLYSGEMTYEIGVGIKLF